MDIRKRIKTIRAAKNITWQQIKNNRGYSIEAFENRNGDIKLSRLLEICEELDISLHELTAPEFFIKVDD